MPPNKKVKVKEEQVDMPAGCLSDYFPRSSASAGLADNGSPSGPAPLVPSPSTSVPPPVVVQRTAAEQNLSDVVARRGEHFDQDSHSQLQQQELQVEVARAFVASTQLQVESTAPSVAASHAMVHALVAPVAQEADAAAGGPISDSQKNKLN